MYKLKHEQILLLYYYYANWRALIVNNPIQITQYSKLHFSNLINYEKNIRD